jgi:hypothetical protein
VPLGKSGDPDSESVSMAVTEASDVFHEIGGMIELA